MKDPPSFPDLPGNVDKRRKLTRFSNKEKERLKKEELKPGMLVKMFNLRARGFAVVLNYPFENTVEVLTVRWWDSTAFIPNPSMEKSTNLIVICEGDK
jgi:hypothetical protein